MELFEALEKQLKKEPNYVTDNGDLKKWVVITKAQNFDAELIELLLDDKELKDKFFVDVKGTLVFKQNLFVQFLEQKNYLNDSYTQYKNKVGLTVGGKYLKQRNEVALVWPFKDCILEGGQNREEGKREEIFFNQILAQDEITQLLEPKVLTNAKTYTTEGEQDFAGFTRNAKLNKKRRLPENTITDNLIIKGNNLLALHSLKKRFTAKVKLIYIDPPYNIGNGNFGYNDRFNHSSWLTFMKNRLETARVLLRDDGSIWINIDDVEAHYLKILCDEVFNRENFIANVVWEKSDSPRMDAVFFSNRHDHLLTFAKNKAHLSINRIILNGDDTPSHYNKVDDKGQKYYLKPLRAMGKADSRSDRPTLYFPVTAPDGSKIYPIRQDGSEGRWRWSKEKMNRENDRIEWIEGSSGWAPYYRIYADSSSGRPPETIWTHQEVGSNRTAKAESNALFSTSEAFDTPKPEKLLQRIIHIATNPNDIVLDFFAGSGTTAAVAHKMGRQFITVEQMDYTPTITVQRLKKVVGQKIKKQGKLFEEIEFDQGGVSKAVGWQGGGSFTYLELKKYNQTFIEQIEAAKNSSALLAIWEQMKEKSFLNYNVDLKKQEEHIEDFKALTLKEQKQHLVELLDKNQLYVNLSSRNDQDFACTEEEKRITIDFYQLKK